jgi:hypothetical protein
MDPMNAIMNYINSRKGTPKGEQDILDFNSRTWNVGDKEVIEAVKFFKSNGFDITDGQIQSLINQVNSKKGGI